MLAPKLTFTAVRRTFDRFSLARWVRTCAAVAIVLSSFGCGAPDRGLDRPVQSATVRVAAASDLKFALPELIAAFRAQSPDILVEPTFGSSGNFYAQLTNKAPFDMFLSADVAYPRNLVDAKLADADSEFLYGIGQIVVWVPKTSELDVQRMGVQVLTDPRVRKIAIANPAHAPYGRAAEAALKTLGIYDTVKDRLVLGDNIAQTAQFVESGAADVGIIAHALALAPNMRSQGTFWIVPLDAYPRLEQGGVIMTWAADRDAANAFREFLVSAPGRKILARSGFILPGD